jgi:zinc protease
MGTPGPNRTSPDYLKAVLGNNILGQFGLMGRIGEVVRDQAGLAYHASTSLNATSLAGVWEVVAGINPNNMERAIDLIKSELERFRSTPVLTEELEDSRANLIGRLPMSMESNAGIAYLLLRMERFNLGLDYLHTYIDELNNTTAEDIQEVAAKYINFDQMVISSAGPALEDNAEEAES